MSDLELANLLKQVRELSPAERHRVREALDAAPAPLGAPTVEDQFDSLLLRGGLVEALPTNLSVARGSWKPVPIQGKPLSQTIIEERR